MAKTIEPRIGQRVYRAYSPQTAGVIINVRRKHQHSHPATVDVAWTNGQLELDVREWDLRDFEALIEDHKKKLETHLATLDKLREIEKNYPLY